MIETSWIWRRIVVMTVLVVSLGLLIYLAIATTVYRVDTALARDIAGTAGLAIMSTVGTYVAGAAWDDRNRMIHGRTDGPMPMGHVPPPAPYVAPRPPIQPPPQVPAPAPAYRDDGEH